MSHTLPPEIKIAKEASITMGGSAVGGILRYLFNILIARLLGVEILGFYAVSMAVTQVVSVVGRLGLDAGVVRFVSRLHAMGRIPEATATTKQALRYGLLSGLILASILIILSEPISTGVFNAQDPFLAKLLTLIAVMIPLMVAAQILSAGCQGLKVLKYPALALNIIPPAFMCLILTILVWWAGPLWSIATACIGSQVLSVGAAAVFLSKLLPVRINADTRPEAGLLRFSIPLVFAAVMIMLLHWSDIIMLGIITDSHTTGLYQPAVRTAGMMAVFTSAFSGILGPIVSDLDSSNQKSRISELLRLVGRWNFAIAWPAGLFLLLYASKVMLVFGADFLAVKSVLPVLALAQVILSLGIGNALTLVMTGYTKLALANNTITLIVNILSNLYFIPRYGPMGAALGTTAAMVTLTLLRLIELWVIHRMHPFSWKYSKPLLAGAVALAACYLINMVIFDWHTIAVIIVGGLVFVSVYVACLYFLKLDEADRQVLAAVRRKLERGMI